MPETDLIRLTTESQEEVARQMQICNACRYCEGLCAVFPAMELRRVFEAGDIDYLSNLCHNCGACYYDCQYAPPHEFAVNVPKALAELREETYERYVWPAAAKPFFERNGLWVATAAALSLAVFIVGFVWASDPAALFASGLEPGAFYRIMPHNTMVVVFGSAFLFAIVSMAISVARFWRAAGSLPISARSLWQAARDAGRLRNLDGGGMGCMNETERPTNTRRLWHHLTFYGFLLCFASTCSGTVAHYIFDWPAPYPWWSPTKILGVLGGIGLTIGPLGLMRSRRGKAQELQSDRATGLAWAFLWMLFAVSVTGMVLTVLRATPAMGLLLAIHLGFVFAFFVTMPYGKFVHGLYRFAALMRHAQEQAAQQDIGKPVGEHAQ